MSVMIAVLAFYQEGLALVVTRGPYLQTGTSTSVIVKWRTDAPTDSCVRYGATVDSLTNTTCDPAITTEHEVKITDLSLNSQYYYSVGTNAGALAGGDSTTFFVTAPSTGTPKPTRVWVLGDSGTADANARAVRDAYVNFTGGRYTDVWLMLGDNAYDDGTDSEYQGAVFDMYPSFLKQSVLWPTLGNHDGVSADSSTQTGPYYSIFSLPKTGEAGGLASGTEAYYSFDYGNIHFVCLDSHESNRAVGGPMLTWLEDDLMSTAQQWILAFWHHPPYSKGSHNSDTETQLIQMRTNVLPILEAHGVDLVLTGHSHSYERSFLLDGHYGLSGTLTAAMKKDGGDGREDGSGPYTKPDAVAEPHAGAVYAVTGSSGQTDGGSLNHPAMYISLNLLGSMVIDVDGERLDAQFLTDTGAVQDYFTIVKGTFPIIASFTPPSGPVGTAVTITGTHFTGTTQVAFNGVAATFSVVSDTQINTTVPAGATTGKVRVTTPAGFADSTSNFTVIGPFDFALSADDLTVPQGGSGSNTITATWLSGTPEAVLFSNNLPDLAVTGLPPDATYSFSPTSCTPTSSTPCTTTLTITAALTTPTGGPTTITVKGTTSGGLSKTTTLTLTVTAPAPTDLIFANGFESGNLAAWSASTTNGGDLSASTAVAIAGVFGLQALLDDNNPIYVTDNRPNAELRYRARFYFDPNSIPMSSGDTHYIFQGLMGTSTVVVRIEFRRNQGNYQVRAALVSDSGGFTNTAWVTISDASHFLEIDWRAATAPGANNGGLTLWVDGGQLANLTGIDNDTRRVDLVRLGAVAGIDSGTRGTYYFDAFESRRQTFIGPDPSIPPPPPPSAAIFADSFESGNLSAWSTSTTNGGDLSASTAAAMAGASGLQAVLDDNNSIYVTDTTPNAETRYLAGFYFDPNSIPMGNNNAHYIFRGLMGTSTVVVRIEFRRNQGNYQVRAALVSDSGGFTNTAWVTISDTLHFLEIDWRAATALGANNGGLTLWVDGGQQANLAGIDNDTRRVDAVRLGAVAGIDSGTRGTYYFDAFESYRQPPP
jgi:hypothetical protein